MAKKSPAQPAPDAGPTSKRSDEPLRTEEVASVSGGTFHSNIARCDTHGEFLPHKLPDGTWCTDV